MKKGWMILSIISALISGMLIYEGAVLFLRYTDRRMGLLAAASGAAAAVLFIFCIFESFCKSIWNSDKDGESVVKGIRTEFLLTCASFGCAGIGILLYRLRFHPVFQIYLYTLVFTGVILIIAAAGVLQIIPGRPKEREFRDRIVSEKDKWKETGRTSLDETVGELFAQTADGRLTNLQAWGAGAILLVGSCLLYISGNAEAGFLLAAIMIYIILNLAVQCVSFYNAQKGVLAVLGQGDAKAVLGFFTMYYERTGGRLFSLPPQTQMCAVAALCDQEAYGDALELLNCIRRKPRMEAFFQQYAWLCAQGLDDRQGCVRALEIMKESMRYLKGKNLEIMRQQVILFQNYMEGNYGELVRAAQDKSKNVFQRRTRERLAQAVLRQRQSKPGLGEKTDTDVTSS